MNIIIQLFGQQIKLTSPDGGKRYRLNGILNLDKTIMTPDLKKHFGLPNAYLQLLPQTIKITELKYEKLKNQLNIEIDEQKLDVKIKNLFGLATAHFELSFNGIGKHPLPFIVKEN